MHPRCAICYATLGGRWRWHRRIDRARTFLHVSGVKISIPLSASRQQRALWKRKRRRGWRVEGRTPRRRTFPGTLSSHVAIPLVARITPVEPSTCPSPISLALYFSLFLSFNLFLFLAVFLLRERFTETTRRAVRGNSLEYREPDRVSSPHLGYTWVAFVSETANADRMSIRLLLTLSLLISSVCEEFVLIAGVYLVLRNRNIPKSLLYRGFSRSSTIFLALYTLTKIHFLLE